MSFNSRFRDFEKCRLLTRLLRDPFGVSVDDLPAEYQLELTELHESDELCATYREISLLDFNKTLYDTFCQSERQRPSSQQHVCQHLLLRTGFLADETEQKQRS